MNSSPIAQSETTLKPVPWWGALIIFAFLSFCAWDLGLFSWKGWPAIGQWTAITAISLWDGISALPLAFWLILGGLWILSKIEGAAVHRWEQQMAELVKVRLRLDSLLGVRKYEIEEAREPGMPTLQAALEQISRQLETIGWHLRAPAQMAELERELLKTGSEADKPE